MIAAAPEPITTATGQRARPRVLFLNRSYWPDVEATGQLLTELCGDLARTYDVTVIAGQPNQYAGGGRENPPPQPLSPEAGARGAERPPLFEQETHQGVKIVRVRSRRFAKSSLISRIVGLSSYLLLASWAALRQPRPDVIVAETDPPVLGALGVLLKWRHRCKLIYYLQDLYPEVGLVLGKLRPGLLTWVLRRATQFGLRHADRIVVLAEDMNQRVQERGIPADRIAIVPNWADADLLRPGGADEELRREWNPAGHLAVMYSGNLGLSQKLDDVLAAARELRGEPVVFLFVGDGAAKQRLQTQAAEWQLDNVRFLPYQPKARLRESLQAGDVHLVPLQRGLAGCIVPSKLYGILACGLPYLAIVDETSEAARITREHGCGRWVEPDSVPALVDAIRWCLEHRAELQVRGQRGRALAEREYDRPVCVGKFAAVLEKLGAMMATE